MEFRFLSFHILIEVAKIKYVKSKQDCSNIIFNFPGHFKFFIAYYSIDNCIVLFLIKMQAL